MFAKFLTELSTPEASAVSLPPRLLQLLPAGAKVAGRGSHPLEDSALARRTRRRDRLEITGDERIGYLKAV
jgi:hypothetical protein